MPAAETISPFPELKLPDDIPRDWYFTFGAGQRIFAGHRDREDIQGEGIALDGYYVVIHGDFHSARERMYELFGAVWSGQYTALPHLADLPGQPEWHELIKVPPAENGAL